MLFFPEKLSKCIFYRKTLRSCWSATNNGIEVSWVQLTLYIEIFMTGFLP
jgi:hypothetical protein